MSHRAVRGRRALWIALAAIALLEVVVAATRHRSGEELLQVAREGEGSARIAAIHRLARRGDGGALSEETVRAIVRREESGVLAFLLLARPRNVDLSEVRMQYRAWSDASGDPAGARLRPKKMKTLEEIRSSLRESPPTAPAESR